MQNQNLVCEKPIAVSKVNLSPDFGSTEYEFKIHHLQFLINVAHSGIMNVFIKSDLIDDNAPVYTCVTKIKDKVVYQMLTLLEYNSKNFWNEHMFTNMMMLRIRFYASGRFPEEIIYEAPTFRVVNNLEVGIIFKYADNALRTNSVIGRVLRSMGTFNIAVLSALHMSTKNQVHRKNAEDIEFRAFEKNQSLLGVSYDLCNNYKNRSSKDATYKARQKTILELLSYEELANLLDISFIPYIGNCSSLSDIKIRFKNMKTQSQKIHTTMPTPFDHTTVTIILKKTSLQENQKMHEIIKDIDYLRVYDYMSAKEFTSSVLNDEGFTLVSISELLECTKSTDQFLKLAKSKADKGDLIDLINIGNTVKYAKLVIRHNHKTKGYSIGKDKVKFKDFNELCHFLSDVEKLVSLFCVNKAPKKEIPQKTEKQTKRDTMVSYIYGKINHRCEFDVYRSQFKMLDFLTQNSLWPDLNEKLKKMLEETPEMHMFNSVPESIKIEKCLDNDGYCIYVSCSYNQQDEHFSHIRVFRDETSMLQWLMNPINLVMKFDKEGKLVKEKQTNLCKRTMFDTALNEYLRSNTSIPYKKGFVYHTINLKDFAMWFCGKKGGHDNQLLDIYNAPTENLGNYRFFIDNGETNGKYLYSLRGCYSDTTSLDWTTNVNDIFSYLFDKYVKSGYA